MSTDTSERDSSIGSRWKGELLDDTYRLESCIAEGGMGVVMLGRDLRMDRKVAVKVIDPRVDKDTRMRQRFEREIKISRSFSHPNIIQLFDYGETESGTLFMVMEYLEGRDLDHIVDQADGAISWERACHITLQILEALAEAHKHDIIHRDIKPANVFLTDRRRAREHVKLLDFGVAKPLDSSESMTGHRKVLGTPDYLAPELLFGYSPSKRSDVYAVGLLFLEMILGRPIYSADSAYQTLLLHIYEPVPMPTFLLFETPIGEIIRRGTLKHPAERYASAQPMLEDLADALEQTPEGIDQGAHQISMVNTTRALASSSGGSDQTMPEHLDLLKTVDPLPDVGGSQPSDEDTAEVDSDVARTVEKIRDTTSEISVPDGLADRAEKTADNLTGEFETQDPNDSIGWRDALSQPSIPLDEPPTDESDETASSTPASLSLDDALLDDVQNIFEQALTAPDNRRESAESPPSTDQSSETTTDTGTTDRFIDDTTVEREYTPDPADDSFVQIETGAEETTSPRGADEYGRARTGSMGWKSIGGGILLVAAVATITFLWQVEETTGDPSVGPEAVTASNSSGASSSGSPNQSPGSTSPASPDQVDIQFRTDPPGADLIRDGEVLGTTPTTLTFDREHSRIQLTLERSGYRSRTIEVPIEEAGESHVVELQPDDEQEPDGPSADAIAGAIEEASKTVGDRAARSASERASTRAEQQTPETSPRAPRERERTGGSPPAREDNSGSDRESSNRAQRETRQESPQPTESSSEKAPAESESYDDIAKDFAVD